MTARGPLQPAATSVPAVFTVPAGLSVLDAVAADVLRQWGDDPMALGAVQLLVPTRRAVRALQEALLRHSAGRPLLLPAIAALGDLDPEDDVEPEPGGEAWLDGSALPPAIPELRRQLLLARLIGERRDLDLGPDQALRLAAELARLLDQIHVQGLDVAALPDLAPPDLADHWHRIVAFLGILTEAWPAILAEEGALDPAARRIAALAARADSWRQSPPDHPVIAAGSTGSIPATAELLSVIAHLPKGAVVLPGLDRGLDADSWRALDDTHPQIAMKELLETIGIDRDAVRDWPLPAGTTPNPARLELVTEVMRPAATTAAWQDMGELGDLAVTGLTRLDCATPQEEAGAIALMMREALEEPDRTAALVTADRDLGRRVAAALGRWGLTVDDSAGRPLAATPIGAFLRLAARCARDQAEPVGLLSLLKHPLAAAGEPPSRFRQGVRWLERAVLRGLKPAPGFAGLRSALDAIAEDARRNSEALNAAQARLHHLEEMATPAVTAMRARRAPLTELVAAHIRFAEALAASHQATGPERLWRGDDGEAAANLIDGVLEAAKGVLAIDGTRYPEFFDALLAGGVVRSAYGGHPRLAIRGPLEARLQQADLLILGGLNEGTWPADPAADPWMSRPMRRTFGLLAPERRIALAAHDFAQGLAAPEIVLTRAERVGGAPSVPARWLLRLNAVLDRAGLTLAESRHWQAWWRALDAPDAVRAMDPPAPRPPVPARPRQLSVTEVGTWMRDPYAIYAKHVLGLRAVDPLAADPTVADRGQAIHAALHHFVRAGGSVDDAKALDELRDWGQEAFAPLFGHPIVPSFWWPRFLRIAAWVVDQDQIRRATARPEAVEIEGTLGLGGPGGLFTLTARADRVDRLADGRLAIIDYKTGALPGAGDVEAGYEPQVPLEAAIAAAGGFPEIAAAEIGELVYWRLSGGEPAGQLRVVSAAKAEPLMQAAITGLAELIARFDDPATPYLARPRAAAAPRFSETAHLARVAEWTAAEGAEDEE